LQEEILKSLEKRERLYLDAVERAKGSLATKRQEAVDIVTRLTDASGGIISIISPWRHRVEKEAHSTEKRSPSPTPPPITAGPAMPIPACPGTVSSRPVPATIAPNPIPTLPFLTTAPCPAIVVDRSITSLPLVHPPVAPSPLLVGGKKEKKEKEEKEKEKEKKEKEKEKKEKEKKEKKKKRREKQKKKKQKKQKEEKEKKEKEKKRKEKRTKLLRG